ncbi:hypothetical protein GGI04_001270 [Coemansia thaxteri]|nr:hypothetical protein GGI04_001270 [Coemansia thaxteri]KAJ2472340.1 hypothetical protein GGI02_001652 [Coemansia sp. RSA 2322]
MSSASAPSFTLRYFPAPGLSETIRLLLTAANVNWQEEHPEWPAEKSNQLFGRLPVLIEKSASGEPDLVISESVTIERYIARTYGFLPADPRQAAQQEQIRDRLTDTVIAYFIQSAATGEKKQELEGKFEGLLDKIAEVHSAALRQNGDNGHFFGTKLSYVDIAHYAFIKYLATDGDKLRESVGPLVKSKLTPELNKLVAVVEADPLIAAQVAKHEKLVSVLAA